MAKKRPGKKRVKKNDKADGLLGYKATRYIMIGVAIVAFSGSLAGAVAGFYAWKEQSIANEVLASTKEIHETYSELGLGIHEVVGVYWNEYSDSDKNYSFLYPKSWYLSESGTSNVLDVSNTEDPQAEDLSVIRFKVEEFPDQEKLAGQLREEAVSYSENYLQTIYRVGGQTGALFSEEDGDGTFGGIVFVTCGTRLYKMSWGSSTPDAATQNEKTMRGIAESLKFIGGCSG